MRFDYEHFWGHCKFCEGFWRGERAAVPVSDYNAWKCTYCQYKGDCDALARFIKAGLDQGETLRKE